MSEAERDARFVLACLAWEVERLWWKVGRTATVPPREIEVEIERRTRLIAEWARRAEEAQEAE